MIPAGLTQSQKKGPAEAGPDPDTKSGKRRDYLPKSYFIWAWMERP